MGSIQGRRGGVRSKLVEPYFQIKLGLMFIIVNLLFSVLFAGVVWWVLSDVFAAVKTYFDLTGGDAALTMGKLSTPLILVGMLVLAFVATTFYVAVHYTHKIYGPLVSINRFIDEMVEGRSPSKLALRDGDELQDLVLKLNILADKYKGSK
jgi:ABC-type multidrug transport system fused ATPase/permease subunit